MLAHCPEPPRGLRRDRALPATDVDALSVVHLGQAAAVFATRSGTLVPVTAGPDGLVPGGLGVLDQAALARILARWSALSDRSGHDASTPRSARGGRPAPDQSGRQAPAIDLRAWHAAATAVELRIPAAARDGITPAQLAELDRGLVHPSHAGFVPGERATQLARHAVEAHRGGLGA